MSLRDLDIQSRTKLMADRTHSARQAGDEELLRFLDCIADLSRTVNAADRVEDGPAREQGEIFCRGNLPHLATTSSLLLHRRNRDSKEAAARPRFWLLHRTAAERK